MNHLLKILFHRIQGSAGHRPAREDHNAEGEFVPAGHFYSAIPSRAEIERDQSRIFGNVPRTIPGIDMNETEQMQLLKELSRYYATMPFKPRKTRGLRYYFENPNYSYSDGILLHCLIRHLAPQRIVEIGSGFSSCATLDTNDHFFGGEIRTTFIEPYPELLHSLIGRDNRESIEIIDQRLQDVDLALFESLQPNDILFVDSTHVAKTGSDVNRIFAEILPALAPGVHVHIHDIFYPFEYPQAWILEGRAWNEIYMLRAFLQYNRAFEIVLMNTFMEHFHEPFFREQMPLCLKNPGGSIWLRRH